jgi:hypothetical protein
MVRDMSRQHEEMETVTSEHYDDRHVRTLRSQRSLAYSQN